MSRYPQFDRTRILLKDLSQRQHDVHLDEVLPLAPVEVPYRHDEFPQLVDRDGSEPMRFDLVMAWDLMQRIDERDIGPSGGGRQPRRVPAPPSRRRRQPCGSTCRDT